MARPHAPLNFETLAATAALVLCVAAVGCGTTKGHSATEQLLLSDAVDRSVSTIDFRSLAGHTVFLDTTYLETDKKSTDIVNSNYVISSLRQQILASGCRLMPKIDEAELIIEPRLGTLGADDHRTTYGIPENNMIGTAASLVPTAPPVPPLPEISIARRDIREAAVKIAAFAYDRDSRQVVWQSGISQSQSTARDTWVMGIGPFQGGSAREGTKLAGSKLLQFGRKETGSPAESFERPPVDFTAETRFDNGYPVLRSRADAPAPPPPPPPPAWVADGPPDKARR